MTDEAELVLLLETTDPIELASARSLLEGHGISHVVQGEHHGQMVSGLFGNPAVVPRLLVARRDLAAAKQVLESVPQAETTAQGAASLEGSVCPVHEQPALATCGRCGTFLCAQCKAIGQPPLCETCAQGEADQRRPKQARARTARKVVAGLMLAPLALGLLALVLLSLARVLGIWQP